VRKQALPALRNLLLLAIAGLLLWWSFRGVDLRATLSEFTEIRWGWLALSIAASLVAFVSRAERWRLLMRPLGYQPGLGVTSLSLMTGYLANLALPRLGEVTRCGSLSRATSVPFDRLLGTVIVERVIDVLSLAICMLGTTMLERDRLGGFLSDNLFVPIGQKLGSLAGNPILWIAVPVLILFIIIWRRRARTTAAGAQGGFLHRITGMLQGILEGFRSVRKLDRPWAFLFHSVLIWVMYFFMSYTCFFALPATDQLSPAAGLFVLVVGGMGMSAPVQGGIGAYHLLVSRGLMLYGLTQVHGLAFATLMHTSQTLVVLILGSVCFGILVFLQRKQPHGNA
jgi:hypothetical protein